MEEVAEKTGKPERPEAEIRKLLEEEGCVFHEREVPEIPEVDQRKLKAIFGDQTDDVGETILLMVDFMSSDKQPITDRFHKDDVARTLWRIDLPIDLREHYEKRNQLRGGKMHPIISAVRIFPSLISDPDLKSTMQRIDSELFPRYSGKEGLKGYANMEDEEKIEFVRLLEDKVIEVLSLFSS